MSCTHPRKAVREDADELVPQVDRIVQLVQAFDVPAGSAEGYEADHVLGTLATRAATEGDTSDNVPGVKHIGARGQTYSASPSMSSTMAMARCTARRRAGSSNCP